MKKNIPLKNQSGGFRKVGFELEFSGLKLQEAARIIQSLYGGTVSKMHRYRYEVKNTRFGMFRVELDAQNLRKMADENTFKSWGIDFDRESGKNSIESILDRLAQSVVPIEIVMPPVPMDEMEELEKLRNALQKNKAEGTKTSLMYAFGMHINIECPDLRPSSLLSFLRAFMLLYPWLLKHLKVDVTRKMTPYVDRFPEEYALLILKPEYKPDKEQLIDDYLLHNATRNRPLDMLPIWALETPEKVQLAVPDEKKNTPRPAFHYRLPNSHVEDVEWRLETELNYWMQVEALAADPDMIRKLSRLYLAQHERVLTPFENHWVETVTILLELDE